MRPPFPPKSKPEPTRLRRAVYAAAPSALLAFALAGAFWSGRVLRDAASRVPAPPSSRASLDQVAENGSASGYAHDTNAASAEGSRNSEATLETVYALVKEHYVDELPPDSALTRGAVRSLLQALGDPNAQFYEPSQRTLLEDEAKGIWSGIGANVAVRAQKKNGYTEYKLVIVSPLPGSPSEAAGLRAGDVVTHVGGKWVLGYDPVLRASKLAQKIQTGDSASDADKVRQTFDAARNRLKGGIGLFAAQMALKGDAGVLKTEKLPGERVALTVARTGTAVPLLVSVPFARTSVTSVSEKPLTGQIGYVKISILDEQTPEAFRRALQRVPHKNGLILDLRNNGGGLLTSAQAVDSALPLPPAMQKTAPPFGYEKQGRSGTIIPLGVSHQATGNAPKIVVLVSHGTSGAAEGLASALVIRHNAALVGDTTFGDASVQTLYPLPDGSAFSLTTGAWLSGRKLSWANQGLMPRFAAPNDAVTTAVALLQKPSTIPARRAAQSKPVKGRNL